jgi:hypothetical protein
MTNETISRKSLTNEDFLKLRQVTEKIGQLLSKRLKGHLEVIKPLFLPRILLGNFIKSAYTEEVPGTEKAFAELQEGFARICEKPFGLPRKLQPPLPPISYQLEVIPYQYPLYLGGSEDRPVSITSPTQWILSYRNECPLDRLKAMGKGKVPRQQDEMRQTLVNHLTLGIFLKHFPGVGQLLEDLRYRVETRELTDLGGLPVVILKAPVETFLPTDDSILQITQISGIAAFQEIVDLGAIEGILDPYKESLRNLNG